MMSYKIIVKYTLVLSWNLWKHKFSSSRKHHTILLQPKKYSMRLKRWHSYVTRFFWNRLVRWWKNVQFVYIISFFVDVWWWYLFTREENIWAFGINKTMIWSPLYLYICSIIARFSFQHYIPLINDVNSVKWKLSDFSI